ncbi:MAG: FIST N-terminal domain-containing protein [Desulfobacterales bacterium]
MKVGIGYGNGKDAVSLGKTVAENALRNGGIYTPSLVIAFCNGLVDHEAYFQGLQTVLGNEVPIIGGSAIGIITNDSLSYEGYPAGAAVIESVTLRHKEASAGGLDKNERKAGQKLAQKLSNAMDGKLLLIFYDSIKDAPTATEPPVINASPPLIKGIEEIFKSNIPIIGGGVIGDYSFNHSKQFCGSFVDKQRVVGSLIGGDFQPYFRIMHGCIPKDGIYHTITKSKGSVIYELDGKPVVHLIDEQYGTRDWRRQIPVKRLTIGVNYGDKFGDLKEENFVNRLITGVLPNGEGIVIFEPDLAEGKEIMFMLRNNETMIESVTRNSWELMEEIASNGEKPVFGLYIDCAGRTANTSDALIEEASEIQNVFNQHDTPLFGFYSGVEIAPLFGRSRGLDWTGVLLVLAKR